MYRGFFFFTLITFFLIPAYTNSVFELDLSKDVILSSASLAVFGTSFLTSGIAKEQLPESEINGLDRGFMYPYRKNLDTIGTATACTALLLPSISLYRQKSDVSAALTYSLMYCQAFFLVTGMMYQQEAQACS